MKTRSFGTVLSGNERPRKQLSDDARLIAIGRLQAGESTVKISRDVGVTRQTIRGIQKKFNSTGSIQRKLRKKETVLISERSRRLLLRQIFEKPEIEYKELRQSLGETECCDRTITRALRHEGYIKKHAKWVPTISKVTACQRLDFALKYQYWTEQWRNVIWSDETSIERGYGGTNLFLFTGPNLPWKSQAFLGDKQKTKKDIRQMFWGAFSWYSRSDFWEMRRDTTAKKQGYSAILMVDVFERGLTQIWEPGYLFQQDNAPVHTAKLISDWLEDYAIPTLDWPPYSPDLNPIENLWAILKANIKKKHPYLEAMGATQAAYEAFWAACKSEWEALDESYLKGLVESMPRRLQAVIDAKGKYTKY